MILVMYHAEQDVIRDFYCTWDAEKFTELLRAGWELVGEL